MASCPDGCKPLLLGDLDVDLWSPVNSRADVIADAMDEADLVNLTRHVVQRGVMGLQRGESNGRGNSAVAGDGCLLSRITSWCGRGTRGYFGWWGSDLQDTMIWTTARLSLEYGYGEEGGLA